MVPLNGSTSSPVSLAAPEVLFTRHPLFLGAHEERLLPLLQRVSIQRAAKGRLLSDPSLCGGFLHLVLLGRLKAYQINSDGDELLLELIEAGGFDGLLPASGLPGHFTEAAEDSLVALITMPTLQRLIAAEHCIVANLLRMISTRLAARETQIQALAEREPMRRLASILLHIGEAAGARHGSTIAVRRLTHQTLGNMLGLGSVAIGQLLRQLRELGAVLVTDDCFRLDVEALRRIIDETPPPPPRSA